MGETIDAEAITLDFAPSRRGDVTAVEVDGEAVVYEPRTKAVHRLDPLASELWEHLDGSRTVRDLSDEMAAAFSEDLERVRSDVLAYVRQLGQRGLLNGVHADPP